MNHQVAAETLRSYQIQVEERVHQATKEVIYGQGGWPLDRNGRVSRKLRSAFDLQQEGHPIVIRSEADALSEILNDNPFRTYFTAVRAIELTGIKPGQLRLFQQKEIFRPAMKEQQIGLFDFVQVRQIRHLRELLSRGVKFGAIRRAFVQLQRYVPDAGRVLQSLKSYSDGRWGITTDDGSELQFVGDCVQRLLFDPQGNDEVRPTVAGEVPADLFEAGWEAEQETDYEAAATSYQLWLLKNGPDAQVCFNLGNVLHKLRRYDAAAMRYHQALELDNTYADAWNNLGNALAQMSPCRTEAAAAYRKALSLDPNFADAHFNLAGLLEAEGQSSEAVPHWRAHLKYDSTSEYAEYARSRCRTAGVAALGNLAPPQSAGPNDSASHGPTRILAAQ